jgi:osmotically-inducible protein OsmY
LLQHKIEACSEKTLRDALCSAVDIDRLDVSFIGGVTYIGGTVGTVRDKRHAEEIAATLCGGPLVNRLRVAPQIVRNDDTIARDVRERLGALPGLEAESVRVRSRNGVVSLSGEIGSWEARRSAENVARLVRGAVNVVNLLKIRGGAQPSAGYVEKEVKKALRRFLDITNVSVKFNAGVLQLTGSVPSLYHRRAAEDLVRWFAPVEEVVNGLTTSPPLLFVDNGDRIPESGASVPTA